MNYASKYNRLATTRSDNGIHFGESFKGLNVDLAIYLSSTSSLFFNFLSNRILYAVDLRVCECLVHRSVCYSVAMALSLCLGMGEFINKLYLK